MKYLTKLVYHAQAIAEATRATFRLNELAKLILAAERQRKEQGGGVVFDMDTWGFHPSSHAPEEQNYCGTAVCAIGLASIQPTAKEEGVRTTWTADERGGVRGVSMLVEMSDRHGYTLRGGEVGIELLGLTQYECDLFYMTTLKARTVASRLRKLAKNREQLTLLRAAGIDYV